MLITVSGLHGTGKTTIGKLIAERLGLAHHSTGEIFRDMARERRMSLVEFSKHAAKHDEIDKEIDERIKAIGSRGDAVLDGQLCWYFLQDMADHKILFTCDDDTRVARIHGRDNEKQGGGLTLEDARVETINRERIEQERYKKLYGVNLSDENLLREGHDIIIDTTSKSIPEVVSEVLEAITTASE